MLITGNARQQIGWDHSLANSPATVQSLSIDCVKFEQWERFNWWRPAEETIALKVRFGS
jgi:hypothetical protein